MNGLRFEPVLDAWPELLSGAYMTIYLSAVSVCIGLVIAIICAGVKTSQNKALHVPVNVYIEVVRNTPFLVQVFFLYFGLPALGLRMPSTTVAILALSINVGAYASEIIRAGIQSIPKGQIEAGFSLHLSPLQIFRFVILRPALRATFPALASQFILLMLSSSVLTVISANELTSIANNIQSRTFTSFEVYIVVTLMYLAIYLLFTGIFTVINRAFFSYPTK
jgi:polar amino acid transport system permease protein